MTPSKITFNKRLWTLLSAVVIVIVTSLSFSASQAQSQSLQPVDGVKYQTAAVTRGSISISISGTGSLIAGSETNLSFPISGELAQVNVQSGDQVAAGDVLAVLDGVGELKVNVQSLELDLQTAQKTLNDYLNSKDQTLASATLSLTDAQAALDNAEVNLHTPSQPRCAHNKTESYYYDYIYSQGRVNIWEDIQGSDTGYGKDYISSKLYKMQSESDKAYINWKYCEGYTEQEITASQATLKLAQAKAAQAQAYYDQVKAASGIDTAVLTEYEASVKSAAAQLDLARGTLAGATLTAPSSGTVTLVASTVGERAATGTFITLTDLANPEVLLQVDETDLENFAVGCPAAITFAAVPGRTFTGTVTQVSPALVSGRGYIMAQGLVELAKNSTNGGKVLPVGLKASVIVTCSQSANTLLVPVEALHQQADGKTFVYILTSQGHAEQRSVDVGLKNYVNAEIRSGLQAGERVIISGVVAQ